MAHCESLLDLWYERQWLYQTLQDAGDDIDRYGQRIETIEQTLISQRVRTGEEFLCKLLWMKEMITDETSAMYRDHDAMKEAIESMVLDFTETPAEAQEVR